MLNDPALFNSIISELESITIDYLNKQIAAGVDALQLFDSWTNTLSWNDFNEISSKPLQRIIQSLDNPKNIPITIFCKNSGLFYPMLENTGCNAISLDWNCDIRKISTRIRSDIAIQGNLDPHLLYTPDSILKERVHEILDGMSNRPGFIFNLGHGLLPDINPEKVGKVVRWVQEFRN